MLLAYNYTVLSIRLPKLCSFAARKKYETFCNKTLLRRGCQNSKFQSLDKTKMLKCVTKDLVKSSISFEIRFCLDG